jgi:hypothetical protein
MFTGKLFRPWGKFLRILLRLSEEMFVGDIWGNGLLMNFPQKISGNVCWGAFSTWGNVCLRAFRTRGNV